MLTVMTFALVLAQAPQAVHAPVVQALVESQQEPKAGWLHAAIAAHVVAQFADISTTQFALGTGRYREANPILRPIMGGPIRMALIKGGYAVGTSYLLLRVHRQHPKLAFALAATSAAVTSVIAARNSRGLRGVR